MFLTSYDNVARSYQNIGWYVSYTVSRAYQNIGWYVSYTVAREHRLQCVLPPMILCLGVPEHRLVCFLPPMILLLWVSEHMLVFFSYTVARGIRT